MQTKWKSVYTPAAPGNSMTLYGSKCVSSYCNLDHYHKGILMQRNDIYYYYYYYCCSYISVFPRSCKFAALICSETMTSEIRSRIIVFLCEWINGRFMYGKRSERWENSSCVNSVTMPPLKLYSRRKYVNLPSNSVFPL
jgi:hypothetical protein